jgi:hypothetical protein
VSRDRTRKSKPLTWAAVRKLALALPDTEESTSYGTPAIKVQGKLFVRLREEKDIVVVRINPSDRAMRLEADPDVFFVTDHYVPYPYMLIRLAKVKLSDLKELLHDAWQLAAR